MPWGALSSSGKSLILQPLGTFLEPGTPLRATPAVVMQWAHQTGSPGQTAAEVSAEEGKYSHAHAQWRSDIKEPTTRPSPGLK